MIAGAKEYCRRSLPNTRNTDNIVRDCFLIEEETKHGKPEELRYEHTFVAESQSEKTVTSPVFHNVFYPLGFGKLTELGIENRPETGVWREQRLVITFQPFPVMRRPTAAIRHIRQLAKNLGSLFFKVP